MKDAALLFWFYYVTHQLSNYQFRRLQGGITESVKNLTVLLCKIIHCKIRIAFTFYD